LRILDGVYQELAEGNLALIVEVASNQAAELSDLLTRIGAKSVWEFDDWTFVKIGQGRTGRSSKASLDEFAQSGESLRQQPRDMHLRDAHF
jgi:hypothetical protein